MSAPQNFDRPLISIITLNYNATEVTRHFLESSRSLNYPRIEILVCDMASAVDPTEELLVLNVPNLRVLRSAVNLGFSGGNNFGAREAEGEFLFFINNDTIMTPDLPGELLQVLQTRTEVGICCPKILFYDHPGLIEYAGFKKMNLFTGRTSAIGYRQKDSRAFNLPGITNGAHGCAMMMRKDLFEEVGGFYAPYFLYYEEWDLSMRILRSGKKIWYQPTASVQHKSSLSVGADSPLKTYYLTRNRILFINRNALPFQRGIFYIFMLLFAVPKAIVGFIVKRKPAHLRAFIRGLRWHFENRTEQARLLNPSLNQ